MLLTTSTETAHVEAPAAVFTPLPPMVKVPVPAVAVMVGAPPHPFTTFGVAAINTFAGSASLKVRPTRAGEPAGLLTVKVSVETWPTPAVDGANALVSVGWFCTVSDVPVTPLVTWAVAVMLAAVLLYGPPATLEVTSTRTAQDVTPLEKLAPVTVMVEPPAVAEANAGLLAKAPPAGQLLCTFGVPATTTLAGSVSMKLMPDCAGLPAPFVIVNVSVEVPPTSIAIGLKILSSDDCVTVRVWLVTPLVSVPPTVTWAAPFT